MVKIHQKNIKNGIFVSKITNTSDFSSQKSKKNRSCFSQTFHMESPNKTKNIFFVALNKTLLAYRIVCSVSLGTGDNVI